MKKITIKKLKFLPTDVSTFSKMVEGDYLYVDKTQQIYDLFSTGSNYFFLSRPRRFGKTLLISTLEELFLGNKKLFKGLWIEKSDWQWKKHPVIRLDLSMVASKTAEALTTSLISKLDDIAEVYKISLDSKKTLEDKFGFLVSKLSKINKVVLLVDEYDYPMLTHITDPEKSKANRDVIKNFFTVAKGLDAHWRAIFITGVSKFSKTSIFSGINNLNDISEKPAAAALLGYTQDELESCFKPYIDAMVKAKKVTVAKILDQLKRWYNGYQFSKETIKVYNPFSVLYYLKDQALCNYWFLSGTPSFLMPLLRQRFDTLEDMAGKVVESSGLGPFEVDNIPLIPLLYQTGYLTIKDTFYEGESLFYTLDYPNTEVRESFSKFLVAALAHSNAITVDSMLRDVKRALATNNIDDFVYALRCLFANIPYNLHIAKERYYHSIIHTMVYLMGFQADSEVLTSKGRLDLSIVRPDRVFVFEFKFDGTAKQALNQITKQRYYEKYLGKKKPITMAGVSFGYKDKMLVLDWVAAEQ